MSLYLNMEDLVRICGEGPATRLMSLRGGTSFYVPASLADEHWLIGALGRTAAEALVGHLAVGAGGVSVEIPRGPAGREAEYRRALHEAVASGQTEAEIAGRMGIHGRTVRRARARLRSEADARQGKLF